MRIETAFLGLAAIVGAMPGLIVARSDLLLLSTTFWCLLIAIILVDVSRRSILLRTCAIAISVFVLGSSVLVGRLVQRERVISNLAYVCFGTGSLYTNYHDATLFASRKGFMVEHLGRHRIYSADDLTAMMPVLVEEAVANNRYARNEEDLPFIPIFRFLTGLDGKEWSCVGERGFLFR